MCDEPIRLITSASTHATTFAEILRCFGKSPWRSRWSPIGLSARSASWALDALAAEGVRSGKLTNFQARRLLGIQSRYEMDGFLKAHGVFLDLSLEDVQKDSDTALASSR